MAALMKIIANLLDLLAGPYRTLTHLNAPPGLLAWLGIIAGVPISISLAPTDGMSERRANVVAGIWFTMLAAGLIQTITALRWQKTPRFWLARGEETFIFVLAATTWHFGCLGVAVFLLAGAVLNMLRSKLIELGIEPYDDKVTASGLLGFPLRLFAGPYRAIAYALGTFGGKRVGVITWLGVLLAYPVFYEIWEPDWTSYEDYPARNGFYGGWIILGVAAWLQMMARWCSTRPLPDEARSHCWVGSWEPFFAASLMFGANSSVSTGAAYFVGVGYFCSLAHIGLVRLQRRIDAWSEEDTGRVTTIVHVGTSRTKVAATFLSGGLLNVLAYIARATAQTFGVTWAFLKSLRRKPIEEQVAYKPPSFASRVGAHMVSHIAVSFVLGTMGIGFVFKCFAIFLAAILWLMGWDPKPPSDIQHETRVALGRMENTLKDKASDAREYIDGKREQASEDILDRANDVRQRAGQRFEEEKRELTTKAQSAVRKTVWGH